MNSFYTDTHPKMEALQIKLLRETPPWRKMEMLAELNESARELTLAGLRQRNPEADETTLLRYLGNMLLGRDIAGRVYAEMKDRA
jgi:hypothetical protein